MNVITATIIAFCAMVVGATIVAVTNQDTGQLVIVIGLFVPTVTALLAYNKSHQVNKQLDYLTNVVTETPTKETDGTNNG